MFWTSFQLEKSSLKWDLAKKQHYKQEAIVVETFFLLPLILNFPIFKIYLLCYAMPVNLTIIIALDPTHPTLEKFVEKLKIFISIQVQVGRGGPK